MEKVFEIYIKTSPDRLWEAITDPAMRAQYTFGVRTESDWAPGSTYQAVHPGAGITISEGENWVALVVFFLRIGTTGAQPVEASR